MIFRTLSVLAMAAALLAAGCSSGARTPSGASTSVTVAGRPQAGTEPAPEFPTGLDWLNTDAPLTMAGLRGKVVLLDFWTYGCINCMHIIPDLERLEEEYPDELVVIGVHSAKFDNERETDNIRRVIVRYGLEHPVVNDRDFAVWRAWGAGAWPTVVVVDPAGNVVGGHSGEGVYAVVEPVVAGLVREFETAGLLDRSPVSVSLERDRMGESVLSFPGKVLADQARGRLFVADTNHHRIVVADLATGEVLDVAGSGERGMAEGGFASAGFDAPQGMALSADGSTLYVADVGNHSVRALDLEGRSVSTLLGTGRQATSYPPAPGTAPGVSLSSPWDLALEDGALYVAMAGSHQVWKLDLASGAAGPVVGSGREGTRNGPLQTAELAQPSGLAVAGRTRLYFADSESSAIRSADFESGVTALVAGSDADLFDFGDRDGPGEEARLQHPLGVAHADGILYVADTYNSKIKRIDLATGDTTTLSGGDRGWRDGAEAQFFEPGGVDYADGVLYVADTNNHAVRMVDPATGAASTLVLYGIEAFDVGGLGIRTVVLDPVRVAPGEGALLVDVAVPDGFKLNDQAPFSMSWTVSGGVADLGAGSDREVIEPEFPLEVPATFTAGSGDVTVDLTVYYCTDETASLCLIEQARVTAPVEVVEGGSGSVTFPLRVEPPDLGL